MKPGNQYDSFMGDPRVSFAAEPTDLETYGRAFTIGQSFSTHVWNDACLASFAVAGRLEAVTFDRGCLRYTGLRCPILPWGNRSFRTAIEQTLKAVPTTHAERLKTCMTLRFRQFDDVSLRAA